MDLQTLRYYQENAVGVAERYESVVNSLAASFQKSFRAGSRVLDIGCGSGRDLAVLHRFGFEAYGVDPTDEFVEYAQRVHPELLGRIAQGRLPDLQPPFGGSFDAVLCSAVLMHIPIALLAQSAQSIKSCLTSEGRLLYSVPSQRSDVVAEHRDANGRLFIPDQGDRLLGVFESIGFRLRERWGNNDSMGRDGIVWDSVLLELNAG